MKKNNTSTILLFMAIFFTGFLLVKFSGVSFAACSEDATYKDQATCDSIYGKGYKPSSDCYSCVSADDATPSGAAASGESTSFTNPLEATTVEGLLTSILSAIQRIIVTLALVFVAIGALMILVSAGSPETVEKGKKAITMALVGLSLGIAAPSILKELAGILGWGTATPLPANVTAATTLSVIALKVLNFLLGISGVVALIMLVIGAIMYLTSAGDEDRIDTGKKIFKNSLIGILIIMASMVLVRQIALFFVAG
jgi:hypothetical protein